MEIITRKRINNNDWIVMYLTIPVTRPFLVRRYSILSRSAEAPHYSFL